MEFIRELGFLNLNARDDFVVLKRFFEKLEFTDEFLNQELDLTSILLPAPKAEEIRMLYKASKEDYDLRRAVMFLKLIRYSYSSGGKSFACQPFNVAILFTFIEQLSKRLANTVIENQDFEMLIKHYDRPDAFFYCDPPYFTSEYVYECEFTWNDHVRLHDTLAQTKGKWMVSYNDCPEIRELYQNYNQFGFTRIHTMAQKYEAGKEFPELLIANYDFYERERQKARQLTLFEMENELNAEETEKILKECIISCKIRK